MHSRRAVHVLMLTADPDLVELYRHECPECVVTIAKDAATLMRKPPKHPFHAVIMESRKDWTNEVKALGEGLDSTPVMTLVGTAAFLRRASETVKTLSNGQIIPRTTTKLPQEVGFDEYVGAKLRDFVRRMKLGAGSNLHPL